MGEGGLLRKVGVGQNFDAVPSETERLGGNSWTRKTTPWGFESGYVGVGGQESLRTHRPETERLVKFLRAQVLRGRGCCLGWWPVSLVQPCMGAYLNVPPLLKFMPPNVPPDAPGLPCTSVDCGGL